MGKSKKPNWGEHLSNEHFESHKHHKGGHHHHHDGDWEETAIAEDDLEMEMEMEEEWIEAEMIEIQTATHYLDEAHEALSRLSQKSNKRGGQLKRPKRADSWH